MNKHVTILYSLILSLAGTQAATWYTQTAAPAHVEKPDTARLIHVANHSTNGKIDSAAIAAALDAAPPGGCIVQIPPGVHQLQEPITISTYGITLRGECANHPYPGRCATELHFPKESNGIVVDGRPWGKGERCNIEGLCLVSQNKAQGTSTGILVRGARTNVKNCGVYQFGANGCQVQGSTAAGDTSNLFVIDSTTFSFSGSNGLRIVGNNANVGLITNVSLESNKGWGIMEEGTLGNNYHGCHAANNTLGAYCVLTPNCYSTFLGCYSESGQPASKFAQRCLILGGLHGSGIDGTFAAGRNGSFIASDSYGLQLPMTERVLISGGQKPTFNGTGGQFVPIRGAIGWKWAGNFWYLRFE